MNFLRWDEVAAGGLQGLGETLSGAVETARSFACGLYRDYDKWFGNVAPYDATGGAIRGLWERICPDDLPPPDDSQPPVAFGGECACAIYRIHRRIVYPDQPAQEGATFPFTGPFYGIERESSSDGSAWFGYVRHGVCSNGQLTGTTRMGI